MKKEEYKKLHKFIKRKLGRPAICQINRHHQAPFDWANISRTYKVDLNDWIRLCRLCHRTFDMNNWGIIELLAWEDKRRIYVYPEYLGEPFIELNSSVKSV